MRAPVIAVMAPATPKMSEVLSLQFITLYLVDGYRCFNLAKQLLLPNETAFALCKFGHFCLDFRTVVELLLVEVETECQFNELLTSSGQTRLLFIV